MNLNQNIDRIENAKASIKASIEAKGVVVGADLKIDGYAAKIDEIQQGSDPVLEALTVTANGSYTPGVGVDGYNKVDVNVPGGASATSLDYASIGYTQTDPAFLKLQSDLAYSKTKFEEWDPAAEFATSHYKDDKNLIYAPLIDTSKVINMFNMFGSCSNLSSVPLFDTSNVDTMESMFKGCSSLTSVPLFDTSAVTNMKNMFLECSSLTSVPLFDTSNVHTMESMFYGCSSLTSVPLFDTSKVVNAHGMLIGCKNLTEVPQFDLSSCENINFLFASCARLIKIPDNLTTGKVTGMFETFKECNKLIEIGEFDCSAIRSLSNPFGWGLTELTTLGGFKNIKISLNIAGQTWQPMNKLTKQSLMNVINDLGQADPAFEAEPTLTIAATPFALLTPEDIAIATAKGWKVVSQ